MAKVDFEKDGRIGRITLNRPDVLNAIDDDVPVLLEECVTRANADPEIHVIILSGAGDAFCAGYDLQYYAQDAEYRTLYEPVAQPQARCLQGAWLRSCRRFRYRFVRRYDCHGR